MTPAARVAAAAEVLDRVLAGAPAEKALLGWSRASRFAGSGDRAAVRDHVFDALRCRRSFAALGGADTGRGLMIGRLRACGVDPASLFTGDGHAPAPLTPTEQAGGRRPEGAEALDVPDWILPMFRTALGVECDSILNALRHRADVFLRVARHRTDRAAAQAVLCEDGIETEPAPLSDHALRVTGGARGIQASRAWREGLVELQDAASQAVCDRIPLTGGRVLDLCAGGGGKALALAARGAGPLFAHDANPGRMTDLATRANRAKSAVQFLETEQLSHHAPYGLVVADVPCSGTGAWRRQPEAKWRLTPQALDRLVETQRGILAQAADLTAPGGCLAYITCSLLTVENDGQIDRFLADRPRWQCTDRYHFTQSDGGDGFFLALLQDRGQDSIQPRV